MVVYIVVFFCKQKTSYDMRISDWSSDVCSSDLFAAMCREGYEGIVSKRADAPYRGKRTKTWLKIKCTRRQEFVIVGWTESAAKGDRKSVVWGKSVSVRVDLGGRRIINKKITNYKIIKQHFIH